MLPTAQGHMTSVDMASSRKQFTPHTPVRAREGGCRAKRRQGYANGKGRFALAEGSRLG